MKRLLLAPSSPFSTYSYLQLLPSSPPSSPFSSENENNKKESLGNSLQLFGFYTSGRQDSNLRPSAPKALNNLSRALCLQAMTKQLRGITQFDMTNQDIFDGNLTAINIFGTILCTIYQIDCKSQKCYFDINSSKNYHMAIDDYGRFRSNHQRNQRKYVQ